MSTMCGAPRAQLRRIRGPGSRFWQTPALLTTTMEIMLLRHGESEGNAQGRMQGRLDYPLTALGREQAARAGEFLAERGHSFAAVYVSPLKRAFETASIVAGLGVRPEPEVDADLPEIGAGTLEGLNEAEIRERHPDFMQR